MTENEKAATFIGWQPGQKCKGCNKFTAIGIWREVVQMHIDDHDAPTPDMSRPENYMMAFEEVSLRLRRIELWHDSKQWCAAILGSYKPKDRPRVFNKPMAGVAARALLAALYDAEHKQSE